MLQSLKRSLKLINKDRLDEALWKVIKADSFDPPKQKHISFIICVLQGQNPKIHPFLAFSRLLEICNSPLLASKWLQGLKLCSLVHEAFQQNCVEFAKSLNANHVFSKLKQIPSSLDTMIFIHITLYQNYISYLELQSQTLEFNCQFQLKQMLAMLKLLVKMHRELDYSLTKYAWVQIPQLILSKLSHDLKVYYTLAMKETQNEIETIFCEQPELSLAKYRIYEDFIKLTRGIKKMCDLSELKLTIFQVDPETNRKIELHIQSLKQPTQIQPPKKSFFIEEPNIKEEEIQKEPQSEILGLQSNIEIPHEIRYNSAERKRQPSKRASFGFKQNFKAKINVQSESDSGDKVFGMNKEASRTSRAQSNQKQTFYETRANPLSFLTLNQKK